MKHAKLAPSAAHRWLRCLGSVAMEHGAEEGPKPYADEGTLAHKYAAAVLNGDELPEVGDEMAQLVRNGYLKNLSDYEQEIDFRGDTFYKYVEYPVPLYSVTGELDAEGTPDFVLFTENELQVHDLKYGYLPVSPVNNEQLIAYALGVVDYYELGKLETVKLVIHQPKISMQPQEWVISYRELEEYREFIKERAAMALSCSEDACRWCKAKTFCPAIENVIEDTIGCSMEKAYKLQNLSNGKDYGFYQERLGVMKAWLKAKEEEIMNAALLGEVVRGFHIEEGKAGKREWVDTKEVEKFLRKKKIPKKLTHRGAILSPTQINKMLESRPEVWQELQQFVARGDGKPVLVKDTKED